MAEQTKKSKYNFGGHELDAKLYLQNIRDNAETFLNSKTDWTPEQKEEWKHAYTNFTNALQEDINNGGGRFSTDEFGTITDTKGEFSNTDSDNYYYNNKGQQISQEDYDALKKRKQGKYQAFEANRQFASYASQIGKGLREALAAKNKTSDDTNGFDYAKNGFDAYWQKKYNPAGTANDLQPYWNKDKEGEYTNRVAETMADLDDYMSKQEMNDDVKAAYTNYRNILGQYNPSDKNFNLDTWKNNMVLAANRAGISGWNNGYFNIGSQSSASSEPDKKQAFDISDDDQALAYVGLTDQALAHPELRDTLLAQARRKYKQESQAIIDQDKAEQKQLQDAQNNKIWQQWLANEGRGYGDVSRRSGIKWYGNYRWSKNTDPEYQSAAGRQALKNLQAALAKTHWDSDAEGLFTPMKSVLSNGTVLNNLGEHLAYYLPMLRGMGAKFDDNFEEVTDNAGHKLWKVKNSKNKAGQYLYIWNKANGKLGAYRDVPFNVKKAEVTKAFYGVKIQSREEKEAVKQKENNKVINNPQTPHDKKIALIKQEKIGGNPFSDKATALRAFSLLTDIGSTTASFSGVGAPASAISGAISTGMNQTADMLEGQGFLESLGNNALSYGMDVLSVIPFVKGITGTGRVIAKAAKLAPHIITALGAISVLKNKDAYIGSWKKMTSAPNQLTRQDWSNIYDSLKLLTAGTRAGTQAIKGNRAMKGALSKDKVKVKTNEGYVTVDKSKLEGIKGTKGLEAQNKALQKATGNSNLRFNAARNKYRFWKTKDQAKIKEADVYDFTKPNTRMINGVEYERPYKWGELGIANHQWQSPKWMNGILDKIEVSGLKPTGRTQADIDYGNRKISQNFSVAQLRELSNKVNPMVSEWKSLQTQAQSARKNAAEALSKARKATDPQIKANYENSAKSYLDYIRNKAKEYQKLKGDVKDGKITFDLGSNKQVELTWNDILKKYGVKYKQGGSIQKLASGNNINGNPAKQNSVGYANDYNWNTDVFSKNLDHILGSLKQYKDGYANWLNTMQDLHYNDYTNASKQDYLNTNAYNNATVGQYQDKYKAGYEDEWNVSPEGNDPDGLGYNTLGIKSAQDSGKFGIVSGNANSGDWLGNGNMYKTDNSFGGITDARRLLGREGDFNDEQLKQYQQKFKEWGYDFYLDPNTKYYKLKPYTDPSKTTVADQDKPKQPNNFSLKDAINKMDVTDKWGIPRAMYADITNRKVTDMLKKQPILYGPQEDHRYVQSDLDAEMNGQQAAAQLARTASHPITSDGNLQSMLQLEATSKGNDAIIAGRQQSNQRLREMQEQAWQQEVANHTSRYNTAMKNRESLYNTANENKALEAAYLNQKFTVWDALAQEKEFKDKSDYEQMRARADQFAQGDINNAIKYGLSNYADKYGLTPEDVSLWNKVYTDGTVKLDDIQKDPIKLRQWNKVLSATRQIQQDLLGEYYSIPKSRYWTVRQSTPFYEYSTEVKKDKKGAKLNLRKVREAAKGEKLAVAQLKAQTADADRFYKTTKDHIDRMYAAISRTMNYSSTKKKRKKRKN